MLEMSVDISLYHLRSTCTDPLCTHLRTVRCQFPQQVRLSCAARNSSVAVSANLFTSDANGTRHITEIVFGAKGDVLAVCPLCFALHSYGTCIQAFKMRRKI